MLETAAVALVSAVIGGILSTMGARWATKRDLVERNRHALLMEDVPWFRAAAAATRTSGGPSLRDGLDGIMAWDAAVAEADRSFREACVRIVVRTRVLGGAEHAAGEELKAALKVDHETRRDRADAATAIVERIEALAEAAL